MIYLYDVCLEVFWFFKKWGIFEFRGPDIFVFMD